jgi:hypothetical protein
MSTSINIIPNDNVISVQDSNNQITITNNTSNVAVDVTQPITNIVQVLTGPQGQKGDQGLAGPSSSFDSGSFVTTSSFGSFTQSYYQDSGSFSSEIGSLTAVTSSYVLNSQTSSMAVLSASFAITASFLPVGTYAITSSWAVSSSRAITASFALNGGVTRINAGDGISINQTTGAVTITNSSTYSSIDNINTGNSNNDFFEFMRAEELEQSKYSTLNIFNTLNFT